jgi:uncharacterized protein
MSASAPYARAHDGLTTHVRYQPFERRFSYRLAQIMVDIDRVQETAKALRLLSYNRFNLFSFHDRDHGDRSGARLRPWAEGMFARGGIDLGGGRIDLLCFPRVLGFVFNPISLFFGYNRDGKLAGVIYEVNNTFGETHAYVASLDDVQVHAHETEKVFHVSPLFAVEGDYRFRIQTPGESFRLIVENVKAGVRQHLASLVTETRPLTDGWLARVSVTMPLSTLQVVLGIHWQALKLFLRGARYHARPPLPASSASLTRPPSPPQPQATLVGQNHD